MKIFRIDQILPAILDQLGVFWFVAALVVLAYLVFANLTRSLSATLFLLLCSQVWWRPLAIFAGSLRWTFFLILLVRGLIHIARTKAPPDEPVWARRLVIAIAALAVASAGWADSADFTASLAVSFCLGLVVTFGLFWRLADDPELLPRMASSVVVLAVILFGSGFVVGGIGYVFEQWELVDNTKLIWGQRYQGVVYNPNVIGLIGAILLPLLFAAPREYLGRVAFLRKPAVMLAAASIFLSGSRSALIGSTLALLILGAYRYRAGAMLVMALGACGLYATIALSPVDDFDGTPVAHIVRQKHLGTLSGREELWRDGWAAAQGHMVIGQGWGASRNVGGEVDLDRATEYGHVAGATNLHNAHLQLLIDVGLVGVALFWAFCWAVVRAGWTILKSPRSGLNEMSLVIFTSALALIADTWVHGGIWSMGNPTTIAFWGLCVLTLKQAHRVEAEARTAAARATGGPAGLGPVPAAA